MVDRALVYRRADEADRRRVVEFLSEHSRTVHERLAPAVAEVGRSLAAQLEPDVALLTELLERLRALG